MSKLRKRVEKRKESIEGPAKKGGISGLNETVETILFYIRHALRSSLLRAERSRMFDQFRNMKGSSVVEYGIMTGMMAIAFAGTVGLLGGRLSTIFHTVVRSFGG